MERLHLAAGHVTTEAVLQYHRKGTFLVFVTQDHIIT